MIRVLIILSIFYTSFSLGESDTKVVKTINPLVKTVYDIYYVAGNCKAIESSEIRSQVSGEVDAITSKQGQDVLEGEFIISINSKNFNSEYNVAKKSLENSRRDYARNEELYEKKVYSDSILEKSKLALLAAETRYNKAREQLDNAVIKADISGVLGVIQYNPGDVVKPGDVLFHIVNIKGDKELLLYVPERIVRKLNNKSVISVNQKDGKIVAVSPNVSSNGSVLVRAIFSDKENSLMSGSYISAALKFDFHKSTTLPENAIKQGDKGKYVYVVGKDQIIQKIMIKTGYRVKDFIEVKGLEPDVKVVIAGMVGVGDKVVEQSQK